MSYRFSLIYFRSAHFSLNCSSAKLSESLKTRICQFARRSSRLWGLHITFEILSFEPEILCFIGENLVSTCLGYADNDFDFAEESCFRSLWGFFEYVKIVFFDFSLFHRLKFTFLFACQNLHRNCFFSVLLAYSNKLFAYAQSTVRQKASVFLCNVHCLQNF